MINENFDVRNISWASLSSMTLSSVKELKQQNNNEDNIRLEDIPIEGVSDLAEVNLGVLLGFRTTGGLHVRFKSPFENRDTFVRVSARLNDARKKQIPVTVGGSWRVDGSFFAVYFRIEDMLYDFTKRSHEFQFSGKRVAFAEMLQIQLEALRTSGKPENNIRFKGEVISYSGLGSDYSYVLLGCVIAPHMSGHPKIDVVFSGKKVNRDRFVDINANLDWAQEHKVPVEIGGMFDGECVHAFYFKLNPKPSSDISSELITLY